MSSNLLKKDKKDEPVKIVCVQVQGKSVKTLDATLYYTVRLVKEEANKSLKDHQSE